MLVKKDGKIILSVKVVPNSSNNEIIGWQGEELKIRIAAPPDKGKANKELVRFLAIRFKTTIKDIEIIKGLTSNKKKILMSNVGIKILEFKD